MRDWVCANCGERSQGETEPVQCPACNRPMTVLTAIATPEDATQAKVTLPGTLSDGTFRAGPAQLPGDLPVPSIQIDERPTRTCAKCGSVMTMFLCEHVFINGLIPSGKRMHFRCTACGKEIKLRSWGRLCLISLACPLSFFMMFVAFFMMLSDPGRAFSSFADIAVLCFMLALSVYPLALFSEIMTRLRYNRLGGGLARSLGDFSMGARRRRYGKRCLAIFPGAMARRQPDGVPLGSVCQGSR